MKIWITKNEIKEGCNSNEYTNEPILQSFIHSGYGHTYDERFFVRKRVGKE